LCGLFVLLLLYFSMFLLLGCCRSSWTTKLLFIGFVTKVAVYFSVLCLERCSLRVRIHIYLFLLYDKLIFIGKHSSLNQPYCTYIHTPVLWSKTWISISKKLKFILFSFQVRIDCDFYHRRCHKFGRSMFVSKYFSALASSQVSTDHDRVRHENFN
jgi:hypothetical protein